ncbi:MAG: hypothetical protein KAS23_06400 [Anaerohalosphaera sp.]|nr:hypothetical protein [Anaerohalosphaera sp.]
MRLWTLQSKGFAIESTPVDHTKSDYYNDVENIPNIQSAYHRLFADLKTDEFLWCFPLKQFHRESEKVVYELEVPKEEIITYICGCVWHKIISNCRDFSNRDCQAYWPEHSKEYVTQQNKKCFSKELVGKLWDRLFWPQPTIIPCPAGIKMLPQQKKEMCSALIKSPIEKEWIISTT